MDSFASRAIALFNRNRHCKTLTHSGCQLSTFWVGNSCSWKDRYVGKIFSSSYLYMEERLVGNFTIFQTTHVSDLSIRRPSGPLGVRAALTKMFPTSLKNKTLFQSADKQFLEHAFRIHIHSLVY